MQRLKLVRTTPWDLPSHFSPMASDFFSKLCRFSAIDRYDAKTALSHPWITGEGEIPLTHFERLEIFDKELQLQKAMRLAFFISVVKRPLTAQPSADLKQYKQLLDEVSTDASSSSEQGKQESEDAQSVRTQKSPAKLVEPAREERKVYSIKKIKKAAARVRKTSDNYGNYKA